MIEVEWSRMTAPDLRAIAMQKNALAILPIGSLEQHGPHLPVVTDTASASEAAIRAARRVAAETPVAVLPGLWLGMSEHHIPFGGTISVDYETMNKVLRCIVRSLKALGFARLMIVNGHGGNVEPLAVSVRELAVEFEIPIVSCLPWGLAHVRYSARVDHTQFLVGSATNPCIRGLVGLGARVGRTGLVFTGAPGHCDRPGRRSPCCPGHESLDDRDQPAGFRHAAAREGRFREPHQAAAHPPSCARSRHFHSRVTDRLDSGRRHHGRSRVRSSWIGIVANSRAQPAGLPTCPGVPPDAVHGGHSWNDNRRHRASCNGSATA